MDKCLCGFLQGFAKPKFTEFKVNDNHSSDCWMEWKNELINLEKATAILTEKSALCPFGLKIYYSGGSGDHVLLRFESEEHLKQFRDKIKEELQFEE